MKNASHIRPVPFARILPAVVAGIVAANAVRLPLWPVAAAAGLALAAAALTGRRPAAASLLTYAAIFLSAATAALATRTRAVMPHGQRLVMTMAVTDTPEEAGHWRKATVRIDRYRAFAGDDTAWHFSGEKAVARFDTSFHIRPGERLIATGYAGELGSADYAGYVRLMQRRGYSHSVWVDGRQELLSLPGRHLTPRCYAARMQAAVAERLSRLGLSPAAYGTAAAMSIGYRGGLPAEVRDDYGTTGASHLLAVSGLHVGIVAMLVNLLLWLLPAFRYGHIVKNAAAITAIWLYTALTGLPPSAVRAAMMFTGAQLALAASRTGNSANILLATATVMLLVNPNYLYDISFQLSFTAVAGIFLFYRPLYGLVHSRIKALNAFWAIFMVGIAASLATAPLVSYYFGRIPLIGIVLNPLLILTANATVLLSLLWIIVPLPLLQGLFSAAIGAAAGLQNAVVGIAAEKSWASLPLRLEVWQVIALYAAVLAACLLLRGRKTEHNEPSLSETI